MLRKNISLKATDYEIIYEFAVKNGLSFSELLRKSALNYIKISEELDLANFLTQHLEFVSDEEQKEIDKLNIDFDDLTGEEIDLDYFL